MASFSSPIVMFCSGPQVHPVTARAGTSWRKYSTRGGVFLFRIPTLIFSAVLLVPTIPTRTSTSIATLQLSSGHNKTRSNQDLDHHDGTQLSQLVFRSYLVPCPTVGPSSSLAWVGSGRRLQSLL